MSGRVVSYIYIYIYIYIYTYILLSSIGFALRSFVSAILFMQQYDNVLDDSQPLILCENTLVSRIMKLTILMYRSRKLCFWDDVVYFIRNLILLLDLISLV